MLLGQEEAGDEWQVRWLAFSLSQTKVAEGETSVWDDPEMAGTRLAVEAGVAVRDRWPEAFPSVHRAFFAARHDQGLDIRRHDVVGGVLTAEGLDAGEVFQEIASGRPRDVFRTEHETAVSEHKVFGVPTVVVGRQAVFVRILGRPGDDRGLARRTVERCLELAGGWPELNELKHTSIPH